MPTFQGSEGVRNAVAATLTANLSAALSALNAEYNDGLPLLPPVQIYAYEQEIVPEFPFVEIFSTYGSIEVDGGGPVGSGWNQVEHNIVIQWFVTADSVTNFQKMSDRYMLAIWRVLQENKNLDGSLSGSVGVDLKRYQMGDIARHKETGILMGTAVWQAAVTMVDFLR